MSDEPDPDGDLPPLDVRPAAVGTTGRFRADCGLILEGTVIGYSYDATALRTGYVVSVPGRPSDRHADGYYRFGWDEVVTDA